MNDPNIIAEGESESLTSPEIYVEVAREGIEEMGRPSASLFWSAIAAGFLISFSLLLKEVLHYETGDIPAGHAIESLGYTIGFILVIYCRLQLFAENTITPVLPTLIGNVIGGTVLFALIAWAQIGRELKATVSRMHYEADAGSHI